jgi:hypothetical protein
MCFDLAPKLFFWSGKLFQTSTLLKLIPQPSLFSKQSFLLSQVQIYLPGYPVLLISLLTQGQSLYLSSMLSTRTTVTL